MGNDMNDERGAFKLSMMKMLIPHFAKGATLADDPLNYVSMAEDEEVVKMLLLVAGDVETNPGPTVSAFSENV